MESSLAKNMLLKSRMLEDMTLSQLVEIIIALKTKHCQEGVTLAERKCYQMAKALYTQKAQNIPRVVPVGSGNNISFDE